MKLSNFKCEIAEKDGFSKLKMETWMKPTSTDESIVYDSSINNFRNDIKNVLLDFCRTRNAKFILNFSCKANRVSHDNPTYLKIHINLYGIPHVDVDKLVSQLDISVISDYENIFTFNTIRSKT